MNTNLNTLFPLAPPSPSLILTTISLPTFPSNTNLGGLLHNTISTPDKIKNKHQVNSLNVPLCLTEVLPLSPPLLLFSSSLCLGSIILSVLSTTIFSSGLSVRTLHITMQASPHVLCFVPQPIRLQIRIISWQEVKICRYKCANINIFIHCADLRKVMKTYDFQTSC